MKLKSIYLSALVAVMASCGGNADQDTASNGEEALSGTIKIDGSSTVYPITAGIAEYFAEEQPGATYYFSPMNVYPFGIVDCSTEPSQLTAYCYYEGKFVVEQS